MGGGYAGKEQRENISNTSRLERANTTCMIRLTNAHASPRRLRRFCPLVLAGLLAASAALDCAPALAQGSKADYEQAATFGSRVANKLANQVLDVGWVGETQMWYVVQRAKGSQFVLVDTTTGEKQDLVDPAAAAFQQAAGGEVDAQALPIDRVHVTLAHVDVLLRRGAKVLRLNRATGVWSELSPQTCEEEKHPFLLSNTTGRVRGESTAIVVVNLGSQPLSLVWINDDDRKTYGVVAPGASTRQHTFGGHRWALVREDKSVAFEGAAADDASMVIVRDAAEGEENKAPRECDQREESNDTLANTTNVEFEDGNVVLVRGNTRQTLTTRPQGHARTFSGPVHWSPDRSRFVVWHKTPGENRKVHIVESSPADQVQPKLISFPYDKPGDRIEVSMPCLFDAQTGSQIALDRQLYEHPRFLSDFAWNEDSSAFSFVYVQRGHAVVRLVQVSRDGETRALISEEPQTFVDVTNSLSLRRLPGAREALWMSERSGFRHLYLFDDRTEPSLRPVTSGPWVVRGIEHVDEANREIVFTLAGFYPQQDPYYVHYARVNFDGSNLTLLTERNATHRVTWSPNRTKLIAHSSRVDEAEVVELRDGRTGKLIAELERADMSALASSQWIAPQPFAAKGRDGTTDIFGVIFRPSNFDPAKKYPVIECIYAGPHGAHVPKQFAASHGIKNELAELGFIVVQIDGMGTAHRSKAFHDVCFRNLADAGLPDRIAWMKAAAAKHPEIDITRVGIFGGSAGGQNALSAVLHHGDFYDAAAADCGCHDNRVDKLWWNEAWMGWPINDAYVQSSNVTHASKLQGKLLLTVGELDRNVDPASTMQVVNALIQADKDFELVIIPGAGHGAGESAYGRRRRADFFVRHLLGREPRWDPAP
jgi:dipeptidyl-peptidase-4